MPRKNGGKFRKKKVNFSMVSNDIIRNENISLRAKGLYSLIQSYISLENFTLYKGFLKSKCIEGERAFNSAWFELKEKGYLIQYKLKDENNQYCYEYELLDEPFPDPQNVGLQNEGVYSEGVQNVCDDNIIKNNTNLNNIISNHINRADLIEQIGYNENTIDDFVENIISLMLDVFNTPDDALIRVNQSNQLAKVVKERFRQIRYKHIEYIRLVFSDFNGEISSFRNYMVTTLYNSVTTCDLYFNQRVNRDLYGKGEKEWQQAK